METSKSVAVSKIYEQSTTNNISKILFLCDSENRGK